MANKNLLIGVVGAAAYAAGYATKILVDKKASKTKETENDFFDEDFDDDFFDDDEEKTPDEQHKEDIEDIKKVAKEVAELEAEEQHQEDIEAIKEVAKENK